MVFFFEKRVRGLKSGRTDTQNKMDVSFKIFIDIFQTRYDTNDMSSKTRTFHLAHFEWDVTRDFTGTVARYVDRVSSPK